MKKSMYLLLALVIQGLFTVQVFAQQFINLPEGVTMMTDSNQMQGLFVGANRGLVGGVIIDTTKSVAGIATIDGIYFSIDMTNLGVSVSETLSNLSNWSLWDGSTLLASTINVSLANTVFERNLSVGSIGFDVFELQRFLNTDSNTAVSVSGPGSLGQEMFFFDEATKQAVMRYQAKYNIPNTGFVGPLTRASLNAFTRPQHIVGYFENLGLVLPRMTKLLSISCSVGGVFNTNLTLAVVNSAQRVIVPPTVYPVYIDQFWLIDGLTPTTKQVAMMGRIKPNIGYAVEASTDLSTWEVVGSVGPTDSTILKEVVASIGPKYFEKAFFRLKAITTP